MKNDCPFCKFFEKTERDILDFEPLNPVVPGHRLVVPREHVENFTDDIEVTERVMRRAAILARDMGSANLITSKGKEATQSVFHLHVHLVPRREGDGLTLPWTGQKKL